MTGAFGSRRWDSLHVLMMAQHAIWGVTSTSADSSNKTELHLRGVELKRTLHIRDVQPPSSHICAQQTACTTGMAQATC